MRLLRIEQHHSSRARATSRLALTLVEVMITMGLFSIMILALIYTQLFGMKQDSLVQSKLGASDQARKGFDRLALEIRSAKIWQVGNISGSNSTAFIPIPNGTSQVGTAVQISLTTDTNTYIRYFFDTNAAKLFRVHSGSSSNMLIARNLTNTMYFQAEDYKGTIQTDLSHKGVIHTTLWFDQYQYPLTKVGPGYYYDSYKMEFRLTPHVPDGP